MAPLTHLTHYILIRKDIPTGAATAQIVHAAGESFYLFGANTGFRKSVGGTVAVVLGVRDERALKYYARRLRDAEINAIVIKENSGPLAGQFTAIGVFPTRDRESVRKVLKKLMPLKEFEPPSHQSNEMLSEYEYLRGVV